MRQPDWRLWLLRDRPREVAQVLFLMHPEWQEFAVQTEIGNLCLEIPCGIDTIRLECDDEASTVSWSGRFDRLEDREAMRQIEDLLAEEKRSQMRG